MIIRWPLRWKVALYAAAMGIIATLAGAGTTWMLMRHFELKRLDRRIASDSTTFLQSLPSMQRPAGALDLANQFAPLSWHDRMVELRAPDGSLLYRSPNLPPSVAFAADSEAPQTRSIGGHAMRVAAFHRGGFTLYAAGDLAEIHHLGWDIVWGMFGALPTVLIVVAVGGRWVARRAIAPVEEIRRAAGEITPQHLERRLPVPPTNDEIAGLVLVLNQTFDRLQASYEQAVRFSADASHQLKTPIAVLRAGIEEILSHSQMTEEEHFRVEDLLHQVYRLTSITENLLLLARADAGRLELDRVEFDLSEILEGAVDDARTMVDQQELTVESDIPHPLPMVGDRRSVALITQNLVENAVKFNRSGGRIRVAAETLDGSVNVTVGNSGEPIPASRASHIFERFYRARGDGRIPGSGLGLSIAHELATAGGGQLTVVRSDEQWTEFRLRMPRVATTG